jgi:hypothetical protein
VKQLLLSMAIGLAAGIIDALPMLLQKMKRRAVWSAFWHYFFVAIVIVNIDFPWLAWWLKGGITAFALAVPIMIITSENDSKAAPIIGTMALILGTLIGLAGHLLKL